MFQYHGLRIRRHETLNYPTNRKNDPWSCLARSDQREPFAIYRPWGPPTCTTPRVVWRLQRVILHDLDLQMIVLLSWLGMPLEKPYPKIKYSCFLMSVQVIAEHGVLTSHCGFWAGKSWDAKFSYMPIWITNDVEKQSESYYCSAC